MPSWRRTAGPGLLLVLLALVSQLVLPPGVMPAAGPGLPLVLCTGHGPAGFAPTAPADQRHDGGAQHACPFAHHGLTSPVSAAPTLALAEARYDVADPPRPVGASPGAGLAAPPPPSHAPPLRLHA
jgi:hypothetical protein